jgi:amino acid adenylation domain-containing protein
MRTDQETSTGFLAEPIVRPKGAFARFEKTEIEQSVPARFEQQVRLRPQRTAIETKAGCISYDALNRTANRVASRILVRRGDNGSEPIAVLLGRGTLAIAAALGVMKAGKIHLTLDPSFPRARLVNLLASSRPGLVVTDRANLTLALELAGGGRGGVLDLDKPDPRASESDPEICLPPRDSAYLLYTSGSTGDPKGVVHTHRNLLHECMIRTNRFRLSADDRWSLFAFGTAQATKNIFSALLSGATLCPWDVKEDGVAAMAGWLRESGITIYYSNASLYREFVATLAGDEAFPDLRLIRLGSEAVSVKDVKLYQNHFSEGCLFAHMFSASEAGGICCYVMDQQTPLDGFAVPVGYAFPDKEVTLVNDDGREAAVGEVGEIVVRSPYLAAGYWGRPDLTRLAFEPDPAGGEARLYRTGDLGRRGRDGCLVHVGRKDSRVKIRGHRVEMAEVEMALQTLDGVKAVAVAARPDTSGQTCLVAYIVPTPVHAPSAGQLRSALAERLAEPMIPSAFTFLEALPTLPNGKIDRGALPAPERARSNSDEIVDAPRTRVERELAGIWSEVLTVENVGIHERFFDLGGDSLMAARLLSRINRRFAVHLTPRVLVETPTVATMAEAITLAPAAEVRDSIYLLKPGGPGPALFLVHDGVGDTLVYRDLAARLPESIRVFAIEPRADRNCPMLHTRIPDMAADYVRQILRIRSEGPFFLGGLCNGGMVAFEVALQLEALGLPVGLVALLDAPSPGMRRKTSQTYRQGFARFTDTLRTTEGSNQFSRLFGMSRRALRKLGSFLVYESTSRVGNIADSIRIRTLRWTLDHGRRPPRFVGRMPAQIVLRFARGEYDPSRLLIGRAILIRATQGSGSDEPLIVRSRDPLFDWGKRVAGAIEAVDAPGGHSSMIQEPHVGSVAQYLTRQMN